MDVGHSIMFLTEFILDFFCAYVGLRKCVFPWNFKVEVIRSAASLVVCL